MFHQYLPKQTLGRLAFWSQDPDAKHRRVSSLSSARRYPGSQTVRHSVPKVCLSELQVLGSREAWGIDSTEGHVTARKRKKLNTNNNKSSLITGCYPGHSLDLCNCFQFVKRIKISSSYVLRYIRYFSCYFY